ncbi:hypothetical protein J437_LFUL001755 [Ladona fulva]|uniref:PX domain-containing protein n=1 Tax=Ladona fulva TaxID=123851 RepID=A0A8K0K0F1_LADFU|nr:hypothetical protein J437_LFUL001755 [Ladona fulva]
MMEIALIYIEVMDEMKFKLEVKVVDPISFSSPYLPSHSSYCIRIKTNHPAFSLPYSEVRRRYSDFRWLRNVIQRHHPECEVPSLPSIALLTWNRFSPEFLENRRSGLEKFLNSLIGVPVYLGEKALHLFMQTELNTKDIELNLEGKRNDSITEMQTPPITSPPSSPRDIESSKSLEASYGEDALNVLLDDGYCSADRVGVSYLDPNGVEVEEIGVGNSSWWKVSCDVPEEIPTVIVGNSTLYKKSCDMSEEIPPVMENM